MSIYPHTVDLLATEEVVDAYGTPLQIPVEPGVASPAFMQPRASTEDTQIGQRIVDGFLCFLPADAPLDGWSLVRWNGDYYEANGSPKRWCDARGVPSHVEANLRQVH